MKLNLIVIFLLFGAARCICAQDFKQDTAGTDTRLIIAKFAFHPFAVIGYRMSQAVNYTLGAEVELNNRISFVASTGFMSKIQGGYLNTAYIDGNAFEILGGIRRYFINKYDKETRLKGLFLAAQPGVVFARYFENDKLSPLNVFPCLEFNAGGQTFYKKLNVDGYVFIRYIGFFSNLVQDDRLLYGIKTSIGLRFNKKNK